MPELPYNIDGFDRIEENNYWILNLLKSLFLVWVAIGALIYTLKKYKER